MNISSIGVMRMGRTVSWWRLCWIYLLTVLIILTIFWDVLGWPLMVIIPSSMSISMKAPSQPYNRLNMLRQIWCIGC